MPKRKERKLAKEQLWLKKKKKKKGKRVCPSHFIPVKPLVSFRFKLKQTLVPLKALSIIPV